MRRAPFASSFLAWVALAAAGRAQTEEASFPDPHPGATALGSAQWKLPIPSNLVGLEVWMQAVRFGEATGNVRDDVTQP